MNGQFTIGQLHPIKYFSVVAVFLGLMLGFSAPMESSNVFFHVLLWQLQAILPIFAIIAIHIRLASVYHKFTNNPWIGLSISAVLGSFLFAPFAYALDLMLAQEVVNNWKAEIFNEWLAIMPPLVLGWLVVNLPWQLGFSLEKKDQKIVHTEVPEETTVAKESKASVLDLLPNVSAEQILYMKSELHYLNVVTDTDKHLILYNLKDAIGDLYAWRHTARDWQVHRSYWVNVNKVDQLLQKGRQAELLMSDNSVIPVSRSNVARIKSLLG